jgi:hypothetical protein
MVIFTWYLVYWYHRRYRLIISAGLMYNQLLDAWLCVKVNPEMLSDVDYFTLLTYPAHGEASIPLPTMDWRDLSDW